MKQGCVSLLSTSQASAESQAGRSCSSWNRAVCFLLVHSGPPGPSPGLFLPSLPGWRVSSMPSPGPPRSLPALPSLWDLRLELQAQAPCTPESMPRPFGTLAFSALTRPPTQVHGIPGAPAAGGRWEPGCHLRTLCLPHLGIQL